MRRRLRRGSVKVVAGKFKRHLPPPPHLLPPISRVRLAMVLRVNNRRTYAKTLVKKDTVIDLTKEKTTISSLSSELLQIPNSKMIKKKLSAEERVGSARQRLQIASVGDGKIEDSNIPAPPPPFFFFFTGNPLF